MFCEKCGNQIPDDSKFCLNCGAQNDSAQSVQDVEQEAAASTDAASAATVNEAAADTQPAIAQEPELEQPRVQPEPVKAAPPVQPAPQPAPYMGAVPPTQQYAVEPRPEKVNPLPTWKFIGMFILNGIPVIGLIMVLVWSFGSSFNRNTKSFARAILILRIIGLVFSIVAVIMYWSLLQSIVDSLGGSIGFDFSY